MSKFALTYSVKPNNIVCQIKTQKEVGLRTNFEL